MLDENAPKYRCDSYTLGILRLREDASTPVPFGHQEQSPPNTRTTSRRFLAPEFAEHMKRQLVLPALLLLALFLPISQTQAQSAEPADNLTKTIQALDTRLFDAYNHCDLTTLSSLLAEDLEFYHDKTGLAVGRQPMVDGIKNYICGKVTRELVPGTLEIYPIANYGAVEIGVHRFHHPNDISNVGEAKFIHLWQNKEGTWKITRAISYDHEPVKK
jgi:hypothetical protein